MNRLEESPVEQVRQIRQILRQPYNDAYALLKIRELLVEPLRAHDGPEVEKDERGWPTFGGAVVELPDDSPHDPRD